MTMTTIAPPPATPARSASADAARRPAAAPRADRAEDFTSALAAAVDAGPTTETKATPDGTNPDTDADLTPAAAPSVTVTDAPAPTAVTVDPAAVVAALSNPVALATAVPATAAATPQPQATPAASVAGVTAATPTTPTAPAPTTAPATRTPADTPTTANTVVTAPAPPSTTPATAVPAETAPTASTVTTPVTPDAPGQPAAVEATTATPTPTPANTPTDAPEPQPTVGTAPEAVPVSGKPDKALDGAVAAPDAPQTPAEAKSGAPAETVEPRSTVGNAPEAVPVSTNSEPKIDGAVAAAAPQPTTQAAAPSPNVSTETQKQPLQTAAAHQIAAKIVPLRLDADGVHRLTVHLHPADLGPVSVVAEIRDGAIAVQLSGGTDAGREALRGALPDLRRELQEAGFSGCTLDLRQDSPQGGQQFRQPLGGRPAPAGAATTAAAPVETATRAPQGANSRLDLHV